MDIIADMVKQLANEDGMPLRVLRQGDGTRRGLIEEFRKDPASVLVGSMSFWEGIDIKGETLSGLTVFRSRPRMIRWSRPAASGSGIRAENRFLSIRCRKR